MSLKDYKKQISTEHETWICAIRKCSDNKLYEGNIDCFTIIPNSERYWRADPFLFKYEGTNYLFCEMLDRKIDKGVIGVAKIGEEGKVGKFRVCLELPYHLSYPCVFEQNGEVYMIPECAQSAEIAVYKAVDFPLKWKKCKTIADIPGCDTTPIFDDENNIESYLFSKFDKINGGNDNLYCLDNDGNCKLLFEKNFSVRPGGHIIKTCENKLIKPTQDDTITYGCGLFFNEISIFGSEYTENSITRVIAPDTEKKDSDIQISVSNKGNMELIGIHTYNSNSDFEVVDFLVKETINKYVYKNNKSNMKKYIAKRIKGKLYP